MDKKIFAFGKLNFIICGIAVFIIIVGFILMAGKGSSIEGGFEPDIFSTRRIVVAPVTCFIGFVIMIGGILAPESWSKKKEESK
ncbi:MAG: putative rane protein [Bacteroidetes bacterium]|jgi:hypothetical protein|nr:putative rane protein [Bacteroidota bacterium]